jgi:hypothetical protein
MLQGLRGGAVEVCFQGKHQQLYKLQKKKGECEEEQWCQMIEQKHKQQEEKMHG